MAFETRLLASLDAGVITGARGLVADAESQLLADPGSSPLTRPLIAAAKARIALSTGDTKAAIAILVMAIEAAPGVAHLRTLLAEVMLATGRAADARPVLHHLGQPPSDPDRDTASADRPADTAP